MSNHLKDFGEILVAFLVAWIFYQGLAFATGTSMPIVSVVSESMDPILHIGDLLFVMSSEDPQVGDIVIYMPQQECFNLDSNAPIVHRIIAIEDNQYKTKGDNNPGPDPCLVSREQIVGKVLFAVPLLGYPRLALYLVGI